MLSNNGSIMYFIRCLLLLHTYLCTLYKIRAGFRILCEVCGKKNQQPFYLKIKGLKEPKSDFGKRAKFSMAKLVSHTIVECIGQGCSNEAVSPWTAGSSLVWKPCVPWYPHFFRTRDFSKKMRLVSNYRTYKEICVFYPIIMKLCQID